MPLRELCLAAFVAALGISLAGVASAAWRPLTPPGHKVFFGVTDTGEVSGFKSFARAIGKHPALIETYHPVEQQPAPGDPSLGEGAGAADPPHLDRGERRA